MKRKIALWIKWHPKFMPAILWFKAVRFIDSEHEKVNK